MIPNKFLEIMDKKLSRYPSWLAEELRLEILDEYRRMNNGQ